MSSSPLLCCCGYLCNTIRKHPIDTGQALHTKVRNVVEMVLKTRGSVDLVALADFLGNVDAVPTNLMNWLEDDEPLSEWCGIETDDYGHIVGIDLKKTAPKREHVDHLLPNLRTLDLSCFEKDQPTAKYIDKIIRNYPLVCLNLRNCEAVCDRHLALLVEAGSSRGVDL